ncbi:MAG: hypothetical protein AAF430_22095 [Myxococcota bacterium]
MNTQRVEIAIPTPVVKQAINYANHELTMDYTLTTNASVCGGSAKLMGLTALQASDGGLFAEEGGASVRVELVVPRGTAENARRSPRVNLITPLGVLVGGHGALDDAHSPLVPGNKGVGIGNPESDDWIEARFFVNCVRVGGRYTLSGHTGRLHCAFGPHALPPGSGTLVALNKPGAWHLLLPQTAKEAA